MSDLPSTNTLLKFCRYLHVDPKHVEMCQTKSDLANVIRTYGFYHLQNDKQQMVPYRKGAQTKKQPTISRDSYRKLLKLVFTGFKVAVGTVATVVSFGGGADSLTDLMFTLADFGLLANSILQVARYAGAYKQWVQKLYSLKWTGNPVDVQKSMQDVFKQIDANKDSAAIYAELCSVYMNILDKVAALFGSLVSTMIPDDLGATRVIIESLITQGKSYGGKKPFDALVWFYNKIPKTGRDALKSKESITNMLNSMVNYLLDLLPNENDSFFTRAKKHIKRSLVQHLVLPLVPGGILFMPIASTVNIAAENKQVALSLSKWVRKNVQPNIPKFADLMMHVLPMTFAVTLMFAKCSNANFSKKASPKNFNKSNKR